MSELRERYINFYTDFAFKRLFGTEVKDEAKIAKFSREELHEYEESLKAYRDWYSVTKTSFDKGKAEGIEEGRAEGLEEGEAKKAREIALKMISIGMQNEVIAQATGLSAEDIDKMR